MSNSTICTTSYTDGPGGESIVRTCLTSGQRIGLAIIAEAGFISLFALLSLAILLVRNVIRYRRYHPGCSWALIRKPPDAYILSLCVADVLQALGAALDVRWVHEGIVKVGSFCRAQGALQQVGETAVAFATMALALHTFVVMWFNKGQNNLKAAFCVIAIYWLFVILYVVISATTIKNYFNPDSYWCWIGGQSDLLRFKISGEYIWLWLAILVSAMVYVPLFCWSMGWVSIGRMKLDGRTTRRSRMSSFSLLAYPLAYSFVILPISIARWATFTGHTVPDAVTFFTVFMHDIFGAVNVILLLTTRHGLLLFDNPKPTQAQSRSSISVYTQYPASPRTVVISRDEDPRKSDIKASDVELELDTFEKEVGSDTS